MKLNEWKKRRVALRKANKKNRISQLRFRPFKLPQSVLIEGKVPENPKLILDGLNVFGDIVKENVKVVKISGRVFFMEG